MEMFISYVVLEKTVELPSRFGGHSCFTSKFAAEFP